MENVVANRWSGAIPSRARRKTASPVARSLLTLFFLITQSDRVEVCGGQGLCTALSYVALAGSECMIGDVMRIQRTPRSMPAVFSPCIQTQGPRLYKERVTVVRKRGFWVSNGSAMQLLCHLMTLCLFPTVTVPWSSIGACWSNCQGCFFVSDFDDAQNTRVRSFCFIPLCVGVHIRVVVARGNRGFGCQLMTLCLFPTVTMPWSSIQLVRQVRCSLLHQFSEPPHPSVTFSALAFRQWVSVFFTRSL